MDIQKQTELFKQIDECLRKYNAPVLESGLTEKSLAKNLFQLEKKILLEVMRWHEGFFPDVKLTFIRLMFYTLKCIWDGCRASVINRIMLNTNLDDDETMTLCLIAKQHMKKKFNKADTLRGKLKLVHSYDESEELSNIFYSFADGPVQPMILSDLI